MKGRQTRGKRGLKRGEKSNEKEEGREGRGKYR